MSATANVVDLNEERLTGLVATIRERYDALVAAEASAVPHAVAIGEALIEARVCVAPGHWTRWIAENIPNGLRGSMCRNYVRLANHRDHLDYTLSIRANLNLIAGMPARYKGTPKYPAHVKEEARRLRREGVKVKDIAARLGTSTEAIVRWTNEAYAERDRQRKAEWGRENWQPSERERREEVIRDRAFRYGEPGRAAVGQAVRRLAQAHGHAPLIEALRDLGAICEAWAGRLDSDEVRAA